MLNFPLAQGLAGAGQKKSTAGGISTVTPGRVTQGGQEEAFGQPTLANPNPTPNTPTPPDANGNPTGGYNSAGEWVTTDITGDNVFGGLQEDIERLGTQTPFNMTLQSDPQSVENIQEGPYVNNVDDVSSKYGFDAPNLIASPDVEKAAANITRAKGDFHQQFYLPLFKENSLDRLQDTSLVESARENANTGFASLRGKNERNKGRYNTRGAGQPALAQQFERDIGIEQSLNYDNTVNSARAQLQDRNTGFRDNMLNIFNGLDADSMAGLDSAVANQRSIETANDQAQQAKTAQNNQTLGTIATIAALIW